MAGFTKRLFGLGKATARHATRDLPDIPSLLSSLPSSDRQALERARASAKRCKEQLHGDDLVSPAVLDELGGAVDGLMDQVQQLADRLVKARAWLRRHDPEKLAREAALAELDETVGGVRASSGGSPQGLNEQARLAAQVEAGVPKLSFRLQTAARALEALEARVTGVAAGAEGLTETLDAQRAKAERALDDWDATARELGKL